MKCQQIVERDAFNERVEELCAKPVSDYRQCGRGCKEEKAYCPEHGAIERATEEMVAHHKDHDTPAIACEVTEMKPMEMPTAPLFGSVRKGVEVGFVAAKIAATALFPIPVEQLCGIGVYPMLPEPLRSRAVRAHEALHRLWSKSSGENYIKAEWIELEAAIEKLVRP